MLGQYDHVAHGVGPSRVERWCGVATTGSKRPIVRHGVTADIHGDTVFVVRTSTVVVCATSLSASCS